MSKEPNDILGLEPDSEQLTETTRSLDGARPVPSPGFRGELGRLLDVIRLIQPGGRWRVKALALAVAGALLLGVAAAGVADSGPLAPGHVASAPVSSASNVH